MQNDGKNIPKTSFFCRHFLHFCFATCVHALNITTRLGPSSIFQQKCGSWKTDHTLAYVSPYPTFFNMLCYRLVWRHSYCPSSVAARCINLLSLPNHSQGTAPSRIENESSTFVWIEVFKIPDPGSKNCIR